MESRARLGIRVLEEDIVCYVCGRVVVLLGEVRSDHDIP